MNMHDFVQGSDAWHTARAQHLCASEAAAALGLSKYTTRAELLRQKATGITPEVTPDQQRLFDRGHAAETAARQWAEAITGEELAPVVATLDVDGLPLLASFDGIDFMGEVIWENKLLNQSLIAQIDAGELEPHYHLQIEHQLLVSGASRCLFTTSDGTEANTHSLWYESRPERRAALIAGWKQFAQDLAAYVPEDRPATVTATPIESLPAVVVQVQGALTVAGNLPAFGEALRDFIARIPAKPATDQQFADAEAACKALKKAEDALTQAEEGALAQISDVELMRRTVADLKALARSTRLATEKLVKAEKDARRTEKVMAARAEFDKHVARLQLDIKGVRLMVPAPDFGGAIKGLSSLASIDEKLTAALIAGKAEANTIVGRITNNLRTLDSVPAYAYLFADRQELAYKDAEVLELLMQKRVDAEQARIESERERIRLEEERKAREAAEREAEAERQRIRAEEQAKAQAEAQAAREAQAQQAIQQAAAPAAAPAAQRAQLDADPRFAAVVAGAPAKCDGDHGGPPCADPHCWSRDADEPATLKLGDVNARLTPIQVTADGLRELGIEPAGRDKRAVLYSESQFAGLCDAIARRAMEAKRAALLPA